MNRFQENCAAVTAALSEIKIVPVLVLDDVKSGGGIERASRVSIAEILNYEICRMLCFRRRELPG